MTRFKDLTKKDIKWIQKLYLNPRFSKKEIQEVIANKFSVIPRTVRTWASNMDLTYAQDEDSVQLIGALNKKTNKKAKRYIITWAQNKTDIHSKFWNGILAYASSINAEVHVIAGRYKNPTSVFTDKKHDKWDNRLDGYLDLNRHKIHKYVSILSDVKTQPTASTPLSGFDSMTGLDSCIIGHPRVHSRTVPVLEGYPAKLLLTTGAITLPNYTDSKAGKKGEFHHNLGFVIVEKESTDVFHVRQVTATKKGEFIDLDTHVYTKDDNVVIDKTKHSGALVLGDTHLGELCPVVHKATLGLIKRLNPDNVVVHDIHNGHSISHHELKDPFALYNRHVDGTNSLSKEIQLMYDWVNEMKDHNLVIVRSNHDDFIDRWVKSADWKKNIHNAKEYLEFANIMIKNKAPKGMVPYLLNKKFGNVVNCLDRDESFRVHSWELSQHGDVGSGGSRGSINQFKRLNTKSVVAHYHKPERIDGALSVGTSTKLRVGYNVGLSAWLNSHVIINKLGKAQHINIINGKYTTL